MPVCKPAMKNQERESEDVVCIWCAPAVGNFMISIVRDEPQQRMPLCQRFPRLSCVLFLIKPNLFLHWMVDGSRGRRADVRLEEPGE